MGGCENSPRNSRPDMPSSEYRVNPYIAYVPGFGDRALATEISSWIQKDVENGGSMLAKSPEDMMDLFEKSRSIVLFDAHTRKPAGHIAFTEEYPDGSLEVGAVIVHESFRGNGAADEMMIQILQHGEKTIPDFDKRPVHALANEASLKVFLRKGYRNAQREELPEEAWALCEKCPRKTDNGQCCDTPVTLAK